MHIGFTTSGADMNLGLKTKFNYALVLLFLGACTGENSAKQGAAEESNRQSALEQEQLTRQAEAEHSQACSNGYKLASDFIATSGELKDRVEAEYSARVSAAESKYQDTLSNSNYTVTAEGVGRALEIKNEYIRARVQSLEKQKKILEIFVPSADVALELEHDQSIRSASGASESVATSCSEALKLISAAEGAANSVAEEFPFLKKTTNGSLEILSTAKARIASFTPNEKT